MAAQPTTHEVAVAPVEGVILDRPHTDIRIPADEVAKHVGDLPRDRTIITYCT